MIYVPSILLVKHLRNGNNFDRDYGDVQVVKGVQKQKTEHRERSQLLQQGDIAVNHRFYLKYFRFSLYYPFLSVQAEM